MPLLKQAAWEPLEVYPGEPLTTEDFRQARDFYRQKSAQTWDEARDLVLKAIQGGDHAPEESLEKWLKLAVAKMTRKIFYTQMGNAMNEGVLRGVAPTIFVPQTPQGLAVGREANGADLVHLIIQDHGVRGRRADRVFLGLYPRASFRRLATGALKKSSSWKPLEIYPWGPLVGEQVLRAKNFYEAKRRNAQEMAYEGLQTLVRKGPEVPESDVVEGLQKAVEEMLRGLFYKEMVNAMEEGLAGRDVPRVKVPHNFEDLRKSRGTLAAMSVHHILRSLGDPGVRLTETLLRLYPNATYRKVASHNLILRGFGNLYQTTTEQTRDLLDLQAKKGPLAVVDAYRDLLLRYRPAPLQGKDARNPYLQQQHAEALEEWEAQFEQIRSYLRKNPNARFESN